jgi:putative tricarboxylic transport membrane protein
MFIQEFLNLFTFLPMMYILVGVFLGIVVGAIPGLTGTMLISLTLPLTFYMTSKNSLILLISMYIGAISGGLITATLLRIPGTPASVVTTFDAYPMVKKGKAGRAIGIGIFSSFIGGNVAWLFLITLTPLMARFALKFSSFELFSLVFMAIVLIASVGQGSILRALISGFLGLLLAMPGTDPILGCKRLTFGLDEMLGGFNLLPVLIGLFGISQILNNVIDIEQKFKEVPLKFRDMFLSLRDIKEKAWNLLRSSLIGTWIGILPGIGGNIGSIMAYWAAKNASKHPEEFGYGSEDGIIASEAANNATINGAIIPMIALGIPGSIITAVLLGALILHDLIPGPLLFRTDRDLVYSIMATALIANFVMFLMMFVSSRVISKIVEIPKSLLIPMILTFCVIGSFALNNRMFDVWIMLAFGLLGFVFEKADIPLAPFIIGFILSRIAEQNLRASLMSSGGSILPFFTRPISLIFIILALLTVIWTLRQNARSKAMNEIYDGKE